LLRTWIRRREVLDDALDDGIDDKLVRGSSSFDGAACDLPDLPTLAEAGLPDFEAQGGCWKRRNNARRSRE
jgi:hypothetical protein